MSRPLCATCRPCKNAFRNSSASSQASEYPARRLTTSPGLIAGQGLMHASPLAEWHCRASDKCLKEKRKTINGDDLLCAMSTLGFEEYVEPLKLYLQKFREAAAGKEGVKKEGGATIPTPTGMQPHMNCASARSRPASTSAGVVSGYLSMHVMHHSMHDDFTCTPCAGYDARILARQLAWRLDKDSFETQCKVFFGRARTLGHFSSGQRQHKSCRTNHSVLSELHCTCSRARLWLPSSLPTCLPALLMGGQLGPRVSTFTRTAIGKAVYMKNSVRRWDCPDRLAVTSGLVHSHGHAYTLSFHCDKTLVAVDALVCSAVYDFRSV
eukprot:366212-Chlamydomonas_euryale.AAC.23